MRITNNMMMMGYLSNLNNNLAKVAKYEDQIANGKAINALSDDPVGLISILRIRGKLEKNDEYTATVDAGLTWLKQTDTSAYELNQMIQSAYETAMEVSNSTYNEDDKAASAEYIKQIRDHVLTIANSQSSDKYIYGGYNVNKAPFTIDAGGNILYNGLDLTNDTDPNLIAKDAESIVYEIGPGIKMDISITGTELLGMGDGNIYTVLDNLYNDMMSNASADVLSGYIGKLQDCQDHVLSVEAKVGGMMNRLELLQNRFGQENLTYTELKSKVEDVDYAEAYLNYSAAQSVYNAALQVSAQILQSSILDYLR